MRRFISAMFLASLFTVTHVTGGCSGGSSCVPQCPGLNCGDDGCGGSCGDCAADLVCDAPSGQCQKQAETWVTLRDGVRLWTQVTLPDEVDPGGVATVLYRTPYRWSGSYEQTYYDHAALHAGRGYAFVLQDCRGTQASEGEFYPFMDEVDDGRDTTDWIVAQPWSNGDIGTIGASYEGYTALVAAVNNPAVKVVLADGPSEGITIWTEHGVPSSGLLLMVSRIHPDDELGFLANATNGLDLAGLDRQLIGRTEPAFQDLLVHPTPEDPHWDAARMRPLYDSICVPAVVTHSVSFMWYQPEQIARGLWDQACPEHRADTRFVLGHFLHGEAMGTLPYGHDTGTPQLMLEYLDHFLGGEPIDLSGVPRVQYFLAADTTAESADTWPPVTTGSEELYLHDLAGSGYGTLDGTAPAAEPASEMIVDPPDLDPCDETADLPVLIYESAPLVAPLAVAGSPTLTLHAKNSGLDADQFWLLMDFDPTNPQTGYTSLSFGLIRARYRDGYDAPASLVPGEPYAMDLQLTPTSWEFPAGHVVLLVAYASLCGYHENPHTGDPLTDQTHWESAVHSVLHDSNHPSRLSLPRLGPPLPSTRLLPAGQPPPPRDLSVRHAARTGLYQAVREALQRRHMWPALGPMVPR